MWLFQTSRDAWHEFVLQNGFTFDAVIRDLITAEQCEVEILLFNDCRDVLAYTKDVLACDIHTRHRTVRLLKEAGAETVYSLADILSSPVAGSGYNEMFGLLGSNTADDERVKLFPRDAKGVVERVSHLLKNETGAAAHFIRIDVVDRHAHVPVVLAAHRQRGAGLRLRRGGMLRGWNHLHLFNGNSNRGAGLCRETSSISLVSDTCLYPTGVGRYTVRPASLLCRAHIAATFSANPPVSVRRRLA